MKKILLIEDDKIISGIYRGKFLTEGFDVEVAVDGQSGVESLGRNVPDLVILDLMLPRLNGIEVIKWIRSRPATAQLQIIVFSNSYLSNLIQDAWKAGANFCLMKSACSPKQLVEVVHKAILQSSAPKEAPVAPAPVPALEAAPRRSPASRSQPALLSAPESLGATPESDADLAFQADLRQLFAQEAPQAFSQLCSLLQAFVKSDSEEVRLQRLFDLYKKVRSLSSNAALADLGPVVTMATAMEAFLKELYDKPKNLNASSLRTVAATIDFLGQLLERSSSLSVAEAGNILVVDDEVLSRRAVTFALDKAQLKTMALESPTAALDLLTRNRFSLVILDVEMPGMDGFELCKRLRNLPEHKKTPVIFVTSLTDFESRARSTLSGGNDIIAKPFLFMELAVKALTYVLKAQVGLLKP